MTRKEFEQQVLELLQDGWREDELVRIEHIKKNNNQTVTGLRVSKEGQCLVPIVYLEDFYTLYQNGLPMEDVLQEIRFFYDMAILHAPTAFSVDKGFDEIREEIIFRLVNYEANQELLERCPHIRLHDLAVTFRWLVCTEEGSISTTMIDNDLMELWGVSREELLLIATENTESWMPASIQSLEEFLMESGGILHDEKRELPVFIATNSMRINGASVILYDGFLHSFAERIQGDFFVLPSSIHEVLLLPVANQDEDCQRGLRSMVREVNESLVEKEDYLSDQLYVYRWKEKRLEVTSH